MMWISLLPMTTDKADLISDNAAPASGLVAKRAPLDQDARQYATGCWPGCQRPVLRLMMACVYVLQT